MSYAAKSGQNIVFNSSYLGNINLNQVTGTEAPSINNKQFSLPIANG